MCDKVHRVDDPSRGIEASQQHDDKDKREERRGKRAERREKRERRGKRDIVRRHSIVWRYVEERVRFPRGKREEGR